MELKNLDTALRMLSLFSENTPLLGVREIAVCLDLSPSVVHRIAATYLRHGFLRQDVATKKYGLGIRFWEMGLLFRSNFSLDETVQALLDNAAEATGETVYLNLLEGDEAICVQVAESSEGLKLAIRLGERTPLLAGSRGRVILAFLHNASRMAIVETAAAGGKYPVSSNLLTDYLKRLDDIKLKGWCLSSGERLPGVVGLSFPIFDPQSNVLGSVTVGGPQARMTDEKIDFCLPLMRRLSAQIQTNLQKFN